MAANANLDIWTTANCLIKRHGDQAEVRAVAHHQIRMGRKGWGWA